jgi:hypothetical protein
MRKKGNNNSTVSPKFEGETYLQQAYVFTAS